jgi:TetR/AcrR family transcriptional repressor of nem operon
MSTRELLIDLGESAIRTRGFGGFSYADLAAEAGIRKASIHHHFPAKTDLGLAVLERYAARLEEVLTAFRNAHPDAAGALRAAVGLYRDALGDGSSMCLCAAIAGDGERASAAMLARLAATNALVIAWFAEVLRGGAADGSLAVPGGPDQAESFAAAMLAQLQGAQLLARAGSDPAIFDAATANLMPIAVRA